MAAVAALGEAQGELLVEAVEAADVGQDDDPDRGGLVGRRGEGREARAVGRVEDEVLDARPQRRRSRGWEAASRVRSTRAESIGVPPEIPG